MTSTVKSRRPKNPPNPGRPLWYKPIPSIQVDPLQINKKNAHMQGLLQQPTWSYIDRNLEKNCIIKILATVVRNWHDKKGEEHRKRGHLLLWFKNRTVNNQNLRNSLFKRATISESHACAPSRMFFLKRICKLNDEQGLQHCQRHCNVLVDLWDHY